MKLNGKEYRVKTIQMAIGCDLIGSKMSLTSDKKMQLELVEMGVIAKSNLSDRVMLIPYDNIKGIELYPDEETPKKK